MILIIQSHAILSSFFLHHLFLISPTDGPSDPPRLDPHELADENAAEQMIYVKTVQSRSGVCQTVIVAVFTLIKSETCSCLQSLLVCHISRHHCVQFLLVCRL